MKLLDLNVSVKCNNCGSISLSTHKNVDCAIEADPVLNIKKLFVSHHVEIRPDVTGDPREFCKKVLELNQALADEFEFVETSIGTQLCFCT